MGNMLLKYRMHKTRECLIFHQYLFAHEEKLIPLPLYHGRFQLKM